MQIQRGPELDCEHTVWGREGWWKCLEAADGGLGVAELRAGPGLGQGPSFPVSCSLSHKATCQRGLTSRTYISMTHSSRPGSGERPQP